MLEDDLDQAQKAKLWLQHAGHQISHFAKGKEFTRAIVTESYDLLILDWIVPDMSGYDVLVWVRKHIDWPIPVLFATQRDAEEDVVRALEAGADDFMTKPIKHLEMLARINALGRRSTAGQDSDTTVDLPPFTVDPATRSIARDGEAIELTQKEFDLAIFLFRNMGRVLSRGHILETVWGRNPNVNTRTVDTHVSRLRNKLGFSKENGWQLSAIYQHGYRLERLDGGGAEQDASVPDVTH